MSILSAVFLGLVQGLAEFLPVSSSGHLSIIQNLFNIQTSEDGHLMFDVLLHLGTLASVCAAYRRELAEILTELGSIIRQFTGKGRKNARKQAGGGGYISEKSPVQGTRRLILLIIMGTLPLAIIVPFHSMIEKLYYNTVFVGTMLIITGLILYVSDKMTAGGKTEKSMSVPNALLIGLTQAIATIPGLSRSGTTITAGVATGLDREFAVRFSFLLSIPAVLGANLITLIGAIGEETDASLIPAYLAGMLVAAITGYFAIALVRRLAKAARFGPFAYYCCAAGIVSIILTLIFG